MRLAALVLPRSSSLDLPSHYRPVFPNSSLCAGQARGSLRLASRPPCRFRPKRRVLVLWRLPSHIRARLALFNSPRYRHCIASHRPVERYCWPLHSSRQASDPLRPRTAPALPSAAWLEFSPYSKGGQSPSASYSRRQSLLLLFAPSTGPTLASGSCRIETL